MTQLNLMIEVQLNQLPKQKVESIDHSNPMKVICQSKSLNVHTSKSID